MRRIQNRKTFEEGDNVIVKGVDRKGTVNKRKGDFYNVTLDAAEEQEKNNVFAGDMVKASRQINSMAIKTLEKYYKDGMLTKKEVIAILMRENGWDYPMAKQVADYYERVFTPVNSSKQIRSARSEEEFQDAISELEMYFGVNAEDNMFPLGRRVTDWDYMYAVDDICRKHNVRFVDGFEMGKINPSYEGYGDHTYFVINNSRQIKSAITWEQYQKYEDYVKELSDVVSKRLNLPTFSIEQRYYFVWAISDSNGYRYDISMDYATPENPDWKNQHHKEGKITLVYDSLTDYNIKAKEFSFYSSKDINSDSNIIVDWFERVSGAIKNSRQLNSRFNQNAEHLYTLSEAAQYLSALFFDLRTIHFLTTGSEFYTYHKLAQDLYEKTEEYYDDLVETAIGYDSNVSPMYVLPGDWNFVDEHGSFDTNGQVTQTLILDRLQKIYDVLESVNEYDSMVQSKIDSMLEYYDKEIYKLKQALK